MTRIAQAFALVVLLFQTATSLAAEDLLVTEIQPVAATASESAEANSDKAVAAAATSLAEPGAVEMSAANNAANNAANVEPTSTEASSAEPTSADSTSPSLQTQPHKTAAESTAQASAAPAVPRELDEEMEDVKKALLGLKRDLVILEEDLLFPASSQVSVFLSLDVGEFFALDAVTLKLNGKEVTHHLYTKKQVGALLRGGVQKLFVGNVKQGDNRVTAFFTGSGKEGRDFRRATTVEFEKGFEPTFIELAITDETADYQPDFTAEIVN